MRGRAAAMSAIALTLGSLRSQGRLVDTRFANTVPAKLLSNIYLNFSNYVHGRYPEAMDMFGGEPPKFHLRGMGGTPKDDENFAMLEASIESISITLRMLVQKFGMRSMVAHGKELNTWFSEG
jgi:hypothetical protein